MNDKTKGPGRWTVPKNRNWRDVLKALLDTAAPNNPSPPTEDDKPADTGRTRTRRDDRKPDSE